MTHAADPGTRPTGSTADRAGETPADTILLQRRGERFRLCDPARGLICESDDLASAYRALEESRAELPWPGSTAGVPVGAVPASPPRPELRRALESLAPLGRPMAFLVAVLLGILIASLGSFVGSVGQTVTTFSDTHRAGRAGLDRLHALAQAAESLSPERSEQIRRDLRTIVSRLAPLTQELAPLIPSGAPLPSEAPHDATPRDSASALD